MLRSGFFPDSKAVSVRILFNSGPLTCLYRTNYFENKTTSIFVLQESINNDSQLPGGPQQKLFRSCSKMFPSVFFSLKLIPGTSFLAERSKESQTAVFHSLFIDDNRSTILNSCVVLFLYCANQVDGRENKQMRTT